VENADNQSMNMNDSRDGLPPVDPDLALLESYLDNELSSAQVQSLQGRLQTDPVLSAALSRLSADFTVRQAVWSSLEGTPGEVNRMGQRVGAALRRRSLWERSKNAVRVGVAVAACLVCFLAGWIGRGQSAVATTPKAAIEEPALYQVAITDEQGNITAVQKFDKLDDAKAFAADVGKWQAEQAAMQNGQPQVTRSPL
jgi:hypothetical protein